MPTSPLAGGDQQQDRDAHDDREHSEEDSGDHHPKLGPMPATPPILRVQRWARRQYMQARDAWAEHLSYRHSYPALVLDALRASPNRHAVAVLAWLLILPGVSIGIGFGVLGDSRGFALGAFAASVALEWRTRSERDRTQSPTRTFIRAPPSEPATLLLAVAEVALVVMLRILGDDFASSGIRGALWGVAITGITDLGRTLASLYLAANGGRPIYRRAFRWANTQRDLGRERTWHLVARFAADRHRADAFEAWARTMNPGFVAVRYDEDDWPDSLTLVWDGSQVWIGSEAVIIPLDALRR